MPLKKTKFSIVQDNMSDAVDVDDSRGRSVPINMNFIETGYLAKDTGFLLSGATETDPIHSIFNYEKKDGSSYFIRCKGTVLQKYNSSTLVWDDITVGTATMTIASPGVVTKTAHGLKATDMIKFSTTGALPTGVTAGTTYYVIATGITADTFQFSATRGGSAINTTGSQSGVHTITKQYTLGAKFGWIVYDDILYGCNAVESLFTWDGTTFIDYISAPRGNILEVFEDRLYVSGVQTGDATAGTFTMTIASPAVVTKTAHGLLSGSQIIFTTTGALPTGVSANKPYYVLTDSLTADTFKFSDTPGGTAIISTGSQSGTHTLKPKGQPLSVYYSEAGTGLFISGTVTITIATPAVVTMASHGLLPNAAISFSTTGALPTGIVAGTTYYVMSTGYTTGAFQISETQGGVAVNTSGSQSGTHTIQSKNLSLTAFSSTNVFKPVGVDAVTGLKNYYGFLLVFKEKSIWKVTRVQDTLGIYYNKQELQSGQYGAISRNALIWVENDIWFFTGTEVRAFGFKDQQTGVLGINSSVLSEQIKETLLNVPPENYPELFCYYNKRRFYLAVSLDSITPTVNNTLFVCHTLYKNNWTKYTSRHKAQSTELYDIDGVMYSVKNTTPYAVLKWDEDELSDNGTAITATVTFKKVEDKDFNLFNIYRYIDLMFKNLEGKIAITVYQDKSDIRTSKAKTFFIGQGLEDELGSLGETDFGESLVADSYGQEVISSPFIKRRISLLSKAQSLTIALSNSGLEETFTIAQFAITGFKQEKNTFSPGGIVSIR